MAASDVSTDTIWSLGYGSNMDKKNLEEKKGVKVLEATPALVSGFRLAFNIFALPFVEPVFANIVETHNVKDEVHGVAFCMSRQDMEKLDRIEMGYNKRFLTLKGYDGRELNGFVYVGKSANADVPDGTPTQRYMQLLIDGAKAAGLRPDYIAKFENIATYKPSDETLAKRHALPAPESLPSISVSELAKQKTTPEGTHWVACCGYIFNSKAGGFFGASHWGRDITFRLLREYCNMSASENDDLGAPPYPLLAELEEQDHSLHSAFQYVRTWQDQYIAWSEGQIVGYVKEFHEQQKSGKTDWSLVR